MLAAVDNLDDTTAARKSTVLRLDSGCTRQLRLSTKSGCEPGSWRHGSYRPTALVTAISPTVLRGAKGVGSALRPGVWVQ
jgi:hypothetical protein